MVVLELCDRQYGSFRTVPTDSMVVLELCRQTDSMVVLELCRQTDSMVVLELCRQTVW